jgi:hypothetical protein
VSRLFGATGKTIDKTEWSSAEVLKKLSSTTKVPVDVKPSSIKIMREEEAALVRAAQTEFSGVDCFAVTPLKSGHASKSPTYVSTPSSQNNLSVSAKSTQQVDATPVSDHDTVICNSQASYLERERPVALEHDFLFSSQSETWQEANVSGTASDAAEFVASLRACNPRQKAKDMHVALASLPCTPGGSACRSPTSSPHTPLGTGVFLGGRYSQEDVIAFGGVPLGGIRSSERIKAQPNADATQLERAQKIAQNRDAGTDFISRFSLTSIPNEVVVHRASKLGVCFGASPSQIETSVKILKDTALQRTLIMLKKNEDKVKGGESSQCLALDQATDLSDDLEEEEQQGSLGHKDQNLPVKKKKKRECNKKNAEVKVVRRSIRIKSIKGSK